MKISVIMPIYNMEQFLDNSIPSILNQSFRDFELLLINDGSQDKSIELCRKYERLDNRVTVFDLENRGVSAARNMGIKMARGAYIRFVDADDLLPEDSLELLVEAMESEEGIHLVIGKYESKYGYYQSALEGCRTFEEFMLDFADYIPSFYYGVVWNKLYRKELIEEGKLQFDPGLTWCEDFVFNLLYYERCRKIRYLSRCVYRYIIRKEGLTVKGITDNHVRLKDAHLVRYEAVTACAKKSGMYPLVKDKIDYFIAYEFYAMLSDLCKPSEKSYWHRYAAFRTILRDTEVRRILVPYKTGGMGYPLLRIVILGIRYHMYVPLFLILCIKERMKRRNQELIPKIRKVINNPSNRL